MRLIDADAYLKKVCTYNETGCDSCVLQVKCPVDESTADAVPIVRCKNCKHRPKRIGEGKQGFDLEFPDWECPCRCDDGYYNWMPEDNWFCGNGEKEEE